jgi:hypothetical protein
MAKEFLLFIHSLVGYAYMRLRYGKYHKRQLIEKFARKYYYAGMTVIWMPVLLAAIIIMSWLLINIAIALIKDS